MLPGLEIEIVYQFYKYFQILLNFNQTFTNFFLIVFHYNFSCLSQLLKPSLNDKSLNDGDEKQQKLWWKE